MPTPNVTSAAWFGLLVAYAILVLATGYLAFIHSAINPAHLSPELLLDRLPSAPEEIQQFVIDTAKGDADIFTKTRDLAAQSFNVVLGALLGFLSASATALMGKG